MATGSSLLLADDSITIQKVINLTFADEGMTVTTVGNGDLALAKIEELSPDIVMLDVHMPGLNGYEICERLKRSEKFRHIPVILLVGSFEPFDEAEAHRVGADDFMTKPFQSIRQLISKVGSLLSNRPATSPSDTAPPARDSDNSVLEYEVAPGQDLTSTRNAVGHGSGATTPLAPAGDQPAAWPAATADYANDSGLDDELIEARPFTGEVARHDTFTSPARPTRPLSALEVEDIGYGVASGLSASVTSVAEPRSRPVVESSDESVLDLGEIDGTTADLSAGDAVLDLGEDEIPFAEVAPAPFDQAEGGVGTGAVYAEHEDLIPEAIAVAAPVPAEVDPGYPNRSAVSDHAAEIRNAVSVSAGELSPESIEAIARRVVELLSDQAVREIAWEVVPQLADLHIRRQLEEKK